MLTKVGLTVTLIKMYSGAVKRFNKKVKIPRNVYKYRVSLRGLFLIM